MFALRTIIKQRNATLLDLYHTSTRPPLHHTSASHEFFLYFQNPTMLTLRKIIKQRNATLLDLHHTSTLPPLHHTSARHDPNTVRYDDLVAEAGKSRDYTRLRQLLIERIDYKSLNTKDTFNFITKTQQSINILNDLFQCLASLPEGFARRTAYESFVGRLCNLGLVDHALEMLDKMRDRNLELNVNSYQPVIRTLTKSNDIEKALAVLAKMKELGINPDTPLYNLFLSTYCMKGDVSYAVEVLEKMMGEEGVKGDAKTYDAMVLGACKAGKVEGAVAVIRAALEDGVTMIYNTYEHVIKALMEEGYYEQAVKFVMCFAGREKGLDNVIFDRLAIGLIRLGRVEEAKMVVDEMSKRGVFMRKQVKEFYLLHESK